MSYCYKCVATYNLSKLEPFKIFFFHLLLREGDTCCRQKRRPRNLGEILLTLLDRVGVGGMGRGELDKSRTAGADPYTARSWVITTAEEG